MSTYKCLINYSNHAWKKKKRQKKKERRKKKKKWVHSLALTLTLTQSPNHLAIRSYFGQPALLHSHHCTHAHSNISMTRRNLRSRDLSLPYFNMGELSNFRKLTRRLVSLGVFVTNGVLYIQLNRRHIEMMFLTSIVQPGKWILI